MKLLALSLAVALTGCANLTPEQNAALGAGIAGAAAIAAGVAEARYNARQPVYVAPAYVAPVYVVPRNCWRSAVTGQLIC